PGGLRHHLPDAAGRSHRLLPDVEPLPHRAAGLHHEALLPGPGGGHRQGRRRLGERRREEEARAETEPDGDEEACTEEAGDAGRETGAVAGRDRQAAATAGDPQPTDPAPSPSTATGAEEEVVLGVTRWSGWKPPAEVSRRPRTGRSTDWASTRPT